ncbi:MAG TPA: hypothetical protein VIU61_08035 [Kofleriaceae bacterium]
MSRLLISLSLVTALTSSVFADRATPRFAQPPDTSVSSPVSSPAEYPITVKPDIMPIVDRAKVRAKLASNRAANLTRFRLYQAKGVFPSNVYSNKKLNVWLDEDGNYCAAATIIQMSGNDDLAAMTAEDNNFVKLGAVKQGPLMDWILTSGLTQAEIAAIQEPFMGVGGGRIQPNWESPPPVLITKRKAEDQRLIKKYSQVEAQIVKNRDKSLDLATDRLMKNPTLAAALLAG